MTKRKIEGYPGVAMRRIVRRAVAALLPLLFLAASGPLTAAPLSNAVLQVAAPAALCMAESDGLEWLAIGVRGTNDRSVSIYSLDAAGALKPGDPMKLQLPCPAPLAAFPNYPLDVAFHPVKPLLYVWQDIDSQNVSKAVIENKAVFEGFDHLLVYSNKDGKAELVGGFARGTEFSFAHTRGVIAISPEGRRLFMSNLEIFGKGESAIGYYDLDAGGMPKPVPVPIAGSLDGHGLNEYEMQYRPAFINVNHLTVGVASRGMVAATREVVLLSNAQGVALWDTVNRRAPLGSCPFYGFSAYVYLGGHPSLPVVYGAAINLSALFCMAHVEGYLTQLPEFTDIPGAQFQSAPVPMPGLNGLAIGGVQQVYLLPLNAQGKFAGPAESVPVKSDAVKTVAFSVKHARLYVPVEKLP